MVNRDKYQNTVQKFYLNDNGIDPYYSYSKGGLPRFLQGTDEDLNFTTFGQIKTKRGQYLVSNSINSQRSGGSIPVFYLAHIDPYGEIVTSDSVSKVRVTINTTYNMNPLSKVYSPAIDGET